MSRAWGFSEKEWIKERRKEGQLSVARASVRETAERVLE
jgi:hypothetical protein